MRTFIFSCLFLSTMIFGHAQTKNFLDQPYLETKAKIDTLVTPDNIYLHIYIAEKDSKGRISVEAQENQMAKALQALGIDLDKQLKLADLSSNFRKYFLRRKDVQKNKSYSLLVYDALTAAKVIQALENINISNVNIERTTYSALESLRIALKAKAVKKARQQALAMTSALNQKLGPAIFISDLNTYYSRNAPQLAFSAKAIAESDEALQPLDVEFKKIQVNAEVSVSFILE